MLRGMESGHGRRAGDISQPRRLSLWPYRKTGDPPTRAMNVHVVDGQWESVTARRVPYPCSGIVDSVDPLPTSAGDAKTISLQRHLHKGRCGRF